MERVLKSEEFQTLKSAVQELNDEEFIENFVLALKILSKEDKSGKTIKAVLLPVVLLAEKIQEENKCDQ